MADGTKIGDVYIDVHADTSKFEQDLRDVQNKRSGGTGGAGGGSLTTAAAAATGAGLFSSTTQVASIQLIKNSMKQLTFAILSFKVAIKSSLASMTFFYGTMRMLGGGVITSVVRGLRAISLSGLIRSFADFANTCTKGLLGIGHALASLLKSVSSGIPLIGRLMKFILNPIFLLIATLILAGVSLRKVAGVSEEIKGIWNDIGRMVTVYGRLWTSITGIIPILKSMHGITDAIATNLENWAGFINTVFQGFTGGLRTAFKIANMILTVLKNIISLKFGNIFKDFWQQFKDLFKKNPLEAAEESAKKIKQALQFLQADDLFKKMQELAIGTKENKNPKKEGEGFSWKGLFESIKIAISDMVTDISNAIKSIWDKVKEPITAFSGWFVNKIRETYSFVKGIYENITSGITKIFTYIGKMVDWLLEKIVSLINKIPGVNIKLPEVKLPKELPKELPKTVNEKRKTTLEEYNAIVRSPEEKTPQLTPYDKPLATPQSNAKTREDIEKEANAILKEIANNTRKSAGPQQNIFSGQYQLGVSL